MSRGRKAIVHNNSDWESVFYNSVGTYVQYINLRLAESIKSEPLSNHIKIVGGYAFKSSQYKKQGVPVIRISDFSNEKIVLDDVVYYDESENLERYELNEGDIVIALTGGTIAKLGIVQQGIGKLYLNQRVGKFEVLHPEEFENEYVYWIARSVQSIIKNLAWGAAIPNVSPKQIEELQFPIPDKETQNGIIDFLNDLRANKLEDDKEYFNRAVEDFVFQLHENQISASELQSQLILQVNFVGQLRQAFLKEAMHGKLEKQNDKEGTGDDFLDEIRKKRKEIVKKEKQYLVIKDEEKPFEIPENWTFCRLEEIADIGTGATPLTSNDDFYHGGTIPWITSSATNNLFVDVPELYITEKALKETNCKVYPIGTLVVAMYGQGKTRGQITELNFPAATNQACATISFYHPEFYLRKFIKLYFRKIYDEIRELAQGGAQPNLNMGKIKNTIIPVPPIMEQTRIVLKLEKLMTLCDEFVQNINKSKSENERLIKVLLNEALGVATTYDITKDKTLKQEIRKFQTTEHSFERIKMKIIEILQSSNEPISATVVWNSSEYSKDIEAFYAELKRLIDIEKLVVEEKRGKESFLKLATNEN